MVCGDTQSQDFSALQEYCQAHNLHFLLQIGDELVDSDIQGLTVEGITDEDLSLLDNLPNLKTLHLVDPQATPGNITGLQARYPGVDISWEVRVAGQTFQNTATEVDLSQTILPRWSSRWHIFPTWKP